MAEQVYPPDMVAHEKEIERVDSEMVAEASSWGDGEAYVVDKQMEQRLLRKFDFFILPLVALMYLFKYVTDPGWST